MAVDGDGVIQAITVEHVADIGAYPACPAVMDAALLVGSLQDPAARLLDVDGLDQHDGQGRVPRPVDVRDDGAGDGDRLRRARDRARSRRVPAQEPARARATCRTPRRPARCSPRSRRSRRSTRRSRCSTTRRSARSRRRRAPKAAISGSGSACTWSPRRWVAPRCTPRAPRCASSRAARVVAFLGTTSHGQSVETTMAQVVADTLGVGYDDVTVVQADTQSTPYGPGTGGSRTAVIAGGAARAADPRGARQGAPGRRARDGGVARRPRDRRQHGVGAGHAEQVDLVARRRADRVRELRHAAARAHERARGHRALPARRGSPRGRTPRTPASSRSTPTRGCRW